MVVVELQLVVRVVVVELWAVGLFVWIVTMLRDGFCLFVVTHWELLCTLLYCRELI